MKKIILFIIGLFFGSLVIFVGLFFYYSESTEQKNTFTTQDTQLILQGTTNANIRVEFPENFRKDVSAFQAATVKIVHWSENNFNGFNSVLNTNATISKPENDDAHNVQFYFNKSVLNNVPQGDTVLLIVHFNRGPSNDNYPRARATTVINNLIPKIKESSETDKYDFGKTTLFTLYRDNLEKNCPETTTLSGSIVNSSQKHSNPNTTKYLVAHDFQNPNYVILSNYASFPKQDKSASYAKVDVSNNKMTYSLGFKIFKYSKRSVTPRNIPEINAFFLVSCNLNEDYEACIQRLQQDQKSASKFVSLLLPADKIGISCLDTKKDFTIVE